MERRKMKLGVIQFGKSRPAPKSVIVDVTFDDKTETALFRTGLRLLKFDKEAVIEYVIKKSLERKLKK